jgi:hypothetical protein
VKTTVTKSADSEEVVVEVDGVKAGRRQDATGIYSLVWERDPRALGLKHRLHPHKITKEFPAEMDPIAPPSSGVVGDAPITAADPTPIVIDVNYMYTAAAAAAAGGVDKMPAFMSLSCALANETYANSGLGYITWRCFGPFKTAYVENSAQSAIYWGKDPAGGTTEVAKYYALTGADLTHYVVTNNSCGIGYMFTFAGTYALSQSERSCTNDNLTFPHETGHNIGYEHDPANADCGTLVLKPSGLMGCASGYNYGHAFPVGAIKWRTIMSYPAAGGKRISQISNPNILYMGLYPTGIANERDNARVAVTNAPLVSAFRTPVVPTGRPPSKVTNFKVQ